MLKEKQGLVVSLAEKDVAKITPSLLKIEAEKYEVSYRVAKAAWKNFVEFGTADLREKTGVFAGKKQTNTKTLKTLPKRVNKNLDEKNAKEMLIKYFNGTKAIYLMKKYKTTPRQFYNLVRELNVSGSVMGSSVLDPKQYAKINVKDVARLSRCPNYEDNLDIVKVAQLKRVRTVLRKWLKK
jgi:isopropylmalate/homocitrate/citramalate synthase